MPLSPLINSFNSGELSPLLDTKTDFEKYFSGCRTLWNMAVLPYGGAMRRPGTVCVADAIDHDKLSILRPFIYSVSQRYILEFSEKMIHFFINWGNVHGQIIAMEDVAGEEDLTQIADNGGDLSDHALFQWKMNDIAATAAVVDTYGNQNGVAQQNTNVLTTAGINNTALKFNGTTDYIQVPDHANLDFTGEFTISFFIKAYRWDRTEYAFGRAGRPDAATIAEYWLSKQPDEDSKWKFRMQTIIPTSLIEIWSDEPATEEWTHIIVKRDSNDMVSMYINGVLQADSKYCPGSLANDRDFYIGVLWWYGFPYYPFSGVIDNFIILDTAVSDEQAVALYAVSGVGPVEVVTPYLEEDLRELHFTQSADLLYIMHTDYYPKRLVRYSHENWQLEDVDFKYGPFLPRNTTSTTIKLSYPVWAGDTYYAVDNYIFSLKGIATGCVSATAKAVTEQDGGLATTIYFVNEVGGVLRFDVGDRLRIDGSNNYDGCWTVMVAASTGVRINAPYVAENFTVNVLIRKLYRCNTNHTSTLGDFTSDEANWDDTQRILGNNIIMTASSNIFEGGHIGSVWQYSHPLVWPLLTGQFTETTAGEATRPLPVYGGWRLELIGDDTNGWLGRVSLAKSYDDGVTWSKSRLFNNTYVKTKDYDITGDEEERGVLYRLVCETMWGTGSECNYNLSLDDVARDGCIKVTGFSSATTVTGEVQLEPGGFQPTTKWAEGAWSDVQGYPSTCTFHDGRLWFGGTRSKPNYFWASRVYDYEDFYVGTLADDALVYRVETDELNIIRWFLSQEVLMVGTTGGEWKLGSFDQQSPITPDNPLRPKIQTSYGSCFVQPVLLANEILFVDRQQRTVRGTRYTIEKGELGGYDALNRTLLAEHITESGIVSMAYQQNPYPVLWCVRADGELAAMTFEPGENIFGWHRHGTDGIVESVAAVPGNVEDEVWLAVQRTINGVTKRYIEYMKPFDWGSDQADCFFVDCGLTWDGGVDITITSVDVVAPDYKVTVTTVAALPLVEGDIVRLKDVGGMAEVNYKYYEVADIVNAADYSQFTLKREDGVAYIDGEGYTPYTSGGTVSKVIKTITGLGHLEAEEVSVLVDGAAHRNLTVGAGQITLDVYGNKVHVGLPFASILQPMPVEIPTQTGTSRGRAKRIHSAVVSFYKSLGCEFGESSSELDIIPFRTTADAMDSPPPLFTGEKEVSFRGGYNTLGDMYVKQEQPLPLTVRGIIPKLEVTEP